MFEAIIPYNVMVMHCSQQSYFTTIFHGSGIRWLAWRINVPSVSTPMVEEERMRPGWNLGSVFYVPFNCMTLW